MGRVFHVLTESEPFSEGSGGAISRWAANVTRPDCEAVVCAPWFDDSWGFDVARLRSIPHLAMYRVMNDLMTSRIPWPLRRRLLLAAFEGIINEVQTGDTVWIHNRPEYAAALSRRIRDKGGRTVLHMHNAHLAQWLRRGHPMPGADMYVFVSRFLEQDARESGAEMACSEVLYNGADDTIFYPANQHRRVTDVPVVLFAGRLVPEKGVHVFLEAMGGLCRAGVSLQGVVIGSGGFGDQRPSAYVRRLKTMAPPNVRFESYCSGAQLGDRFRAADIFCQPSCWHDPFPLAVLEAMACRLPVVTTRSGGIPEALAQGGGVMVTRGDVPELQAALTRFALDADERNRTGELGYASFQQNFTWQCVRDRYWEILMRVGGGEIATLSSGTARLPQKGFAYGSSH
jgi:spore coat protein SA